MGKEKYQGWAQEVMLILQTKVMDNEWEPWKTFKLGWNHKQKILLLTTKWFSILMIYCILCICTHLNIKLIINLQNITWMRKTTQSMYQSNIKAPVTASTVFDGSNLYKSSTAIQGIFATYAGPTRKV